MFLESKGFLVDTREFRVILLELWPQEFEQLDLLRLKFFMKTTANIFSGCLP
jgi:hypothetical protein